jgi:hypothetical protein
MTNVKRKPASLMGAPISAQECQELKAAFKERYAGQVPSVFLSRELILKSIEGLSNLSGIIFSYGLNDADVTASRRITLVPTRNTTSGESAIIPVIDRNGFLCDNGERVDFEKFLALSGNHVTDFRKLESEMSLTKLPKGYFWGINKILNLLNVENCAGVVFHFGYNIAMQSPCRRFQSVLEAVDSNNASLNTFMEYGQCTPPCDPEDPSWIFTIFAERFSEEAADRDLNLLRAFRDNWLLKQENGQALFEMYYFLSPGLVAEINDRADQDAIWQDLYNNEYSKLLNLVKHNKFEEAQAIYVEMMNNMKERFLMQELKTEVLI